MIRRLTAFLRAETGIARADYAGALLLATMANQVVGHQSGVLRAALEPVFSFLG